MTVREAQGWQRVGWARCSAVCVARCGALLWLAVLRGEGMGRPAASQKDRRRADSGNGTAAPSHPPRLTGVAVDFGDRDRCRGRVVSLLRDPSRRSITHSHRQGQATAGRRRVKTRQRGYGRARFGVKAIYPMAVDRMLMALNVDV